MRLNRIFATFVSAAFLTGAWLRLQKCSDAFFPPHFTSFKWIRRSSAAAKQRLETADSVFLASPRGGKHKDVWMRGRAALPCQCPKWLSVPSASSLGSGTTGTARGSRLNRITVSDARTHARRQAERIRVDGCFHFCRTDGRPADALMGPSESPLQPDSEGRDCTGLLSR